MALFMDRHDLPDATAADLAAAHMRDLEVQDQFGVRFVTYWFEPEACSGFCLIEGPDAESVEAGPPCGPRLASLARDRGRSSRSTWLLRPAEHASSWRAIRGKRVSRDPLYRYSRLDAPNSRTGGPRGDASAPRTRFDRPHRPGSVWRHRGQAHRRRDHGVRSFPPTRHSAPQSRLSVNCINATPPSMRCMCALAWRPGNPSLRTTTSSGRRCSRPRGSARTLSRAASSSRRAYMISAAARTSGSRTADRSRSRDLASRSGITRSTGASDADRHTRRPGPRHPDI